MKTRSENIAIITGLFGLDQDLLNDTIGFYGKKFDYYTNEQLEKFRIICEKWEEDAQFYMEEEDRIRNQYIDSEY